MNRPRLLELVAPYYKAVTALIAPGAVIIGSAVLETSDGGTSITGAEWITAIVACIVSTGAVYAVPNKATGEVTPPQS